MVPEVPKVGFSRVLGVAIAVIVSAALFAQAPERQANPQGRQQAPPPGRGPARAMPAQEAPRGTAILRGQIVAADNGAPIRRAQVRVFSPQGSDGRLATTDAQGRFEIKELAAGRYTMTASKGGFVSLQYGQRRPSESGTPIELGDGQRLDKLLIALPRGSVIGGRITDEFGEPVANASVMAMRYAYAAGGRRLVPATGATSRDTTDDQGQYRLFGLPPGEYYVSAVLRTGDTEAVDPTGEVSGYAATYFPGTANLTEAARVTLAVSQENTGVSFGLIATRLVRIAGQVIMSDGSPAGGGTVLLAPGGSGPARVPAMQNGATGRIDQSGAFRLTNVAPGRYSVQARAGGRGPRGGGPEAESARMDLAVGLEDVDGITLVTAPGAVISGSVATDTGEPFDFRPDQLQIAARPATLDTTLGAGGANASRVSSEWTFEIRNIFDARLFRVNAPQGWSLKSVSLNGDDITDVPVELPPGQATAGLHIVLTKKVSSLSGLVADSRGNPVVDATVVVFPADEKLWSYQSRFVRAARPDQEGRYRLNALPPSRDYLLIALQGLEDGQAGDPEFLASVKEHAAKFDLGEGENKAVDVRLTTPK